MLFAGRCSSQRLVNYTRTADLCIAPIESGSGTRLKIIEYLAAERPVVSTPKGAEGLGLESGTHALIAERDGFPAAVLQLLNDRELGARLARQGKQVAKARFDFRTVIGPKWRAVFSQFVTQTPRDDPARIR